MSEARREQFEREAKQYFPDCTPEERANWVESCVLTHPGHDNERTFRPKDFEVLFTRQAKAHELLMAMEKAAAQSQGEILALLGKYYEQDGLTQAAILAHLQDSAEDSRKQRSAALDRVIGACHEVAMAATEWGATCENTLKVNQRWAIEQARIVGYWRYGVAVLLAAIVVELGVIIAR